MNERSFFDRKINFYSLLDTIVKRWYIIVVIMVLSAVASIIYSMLFLAPSYSSSAKLYIINQEETDISSTELAISSSLVKDFEVIINDDVIINEVAKHLNYKYTPAQIKSFISVSNPANTRIIQLTAISPDREASTEIINSLCDILQEKIIDIMGVDRISVISQGNLTIEPVRNKQIKTVSYSLLGGLGLSALIIVIINLTNTRISSSREVEDILHLNVLATIPYNKSKKVKN